MVLKYIKVTTEIITFKVAHSPSNLFFQNSGQNHQLIAEAYVLVPALHGIGQIPIDKNPGGLFYR